MDINIIEKKPKLKMVWTGRCLPVKEWFLKHKVSSQVCSEEEILIRISLYFGTKNIGIW